MTGAGITHIRSSAGARRPGRGAGPDIRPACVIYACSDVHDVPLWMRAGGGEASAVVRRCREDRFQTAARRPAQCAVAWTPCRVGSPRAAVTPQCAPSSRSLLISQSECNEDREHTKATYTSRALHPRRCYDLRRNASKGCPRRASPRRGALEDANAARLHHPALDQQTDRVLTWPRSHTRGQETLSPCSQVGFQEGLGTVRRRQRSRDRPLQRCPRGRVPRGLVRRLGLYSRRRGSLRGVMRVSGRDMRTELVSDYASSDYAKANASSHVFKWSRSAYMRV